MANIEASIANLSSVISHGFDEKIKNVHTSLPAFVVDFDPAAQTITAQVGIKKVIKTTQNEQETLIPLDVPPILDVPVITPRGGGYSLTFPIAAGDECLLIFSERSIKDWLNVGQTVKPTTKRFHDLTDAVAIVGLSSLPRKIQNYNASALELRKDDGAAFIKISDDNSIRIQNGSGYVELKADGTFDINGLIFSEHIHLQLPNNKPTSEPQ